MFYVYLIKSINFPDQIYTGFTQDMGNRLKEHNAGECFHTSKFKPWEIITYIAFSNKENAITFEKYLKSSSGRAFAQKRLW